MRKVTSINEVEQYGIIKNNGEPDVELGNEAPNTQRDIFHQQISMQRKIEHQKMSIGNFVD